MRPQKLQCLLNKAIRQYLDNGSIAPMKKLLVPMKRQWEKWAEDEGDYRGGIETYGYSDTESNRNNMVYISDRWRCAFRLRWLIDGVETGAFNTHHCTNNGD